MRAVLIALCLACLAASAVASPDPAPATPSYPGTAPGRHAQAWFAAYAAGEDAMRAFWGEHGSPASLAQRPVEVRLQVARQIRDDNGTLEPVRVTASGDDFCEVLARSEKNGMLLVRFLCDADAPHGLVAIRTQPADEGAQQESGAPPPGGDHERQPVGGPGAGAPPLETLAETGPAPTDPLIAVSLGAQLDSLIRAGQFSGAVLLAKGGTTLFSRAGGMASRAGNRANTLETRFNLGSLNKIFTHVAIEQLAQAGRLRLDDPVTRWLPDYKVANADRITLRMLLDHRGGVPDMFENSRWEKLPPGRVRTLADWYALVRDMPLRFEPGTRQQYSNGGFVLLGAVVAATSGEDYYAYVRRHIYVPAGMTRSDHYSRDERVADLATGYTRSGGPGGGSDMLGGLSPNTSMLPGRGSPAGGGYATAGDLVRFANALRAGTLLDESHVRDVFGESFSAGLAGGSPGVNALFVVAGPYTLVVLANMDPPAAERFAPTVGRMLRRAAGLPEPARR